MKEDVISILGAAILFLFVVLPLLLAYGWAGLGFYLAGMGIFTGVGMLLWWWVKRVDAMTGWDVDKVAKNRQPTVIESGCKNESFMPHSAEQESRHG